MRKKMLEERIEQALRWSERYLHTDMTYLASNATWLTIGQIVAAAISFGLSIAYANYVPKEAYGTYRFLLSLYWTLIAFSLTGLPTVLARAIARGHDGSYRAAFGLSLVWSIPMIVISLGVSAYYFLAGNMLLGYGLIIVACGAPLYQAGLLYGPFLEGKKDFRRNALFGMVLSAIPAILLFATMHATDNPLALFTVYVASNLAVGLFFAYITFRTYRPNGDAQEDLQNLSLHYSAMNILSTVSQQLDKLLVFHYVGAAELAAYAFATAIPDQGKMVLNNIAIVAFPKFSQRPMSEIRKSFWRKMWQLIALMSIGIIFYIVIAPYIFRIFFPAYVESIVFSQLYALSLIGIASSIPLTLFQAHAAKRELYIYNVASPLFQIGALFALVAFYGIIGAILARIAARLFNLALSTTLLQIYARRAG